MSDTAHGTMTITDAGSGSARVRDYIDLLKPRVMSLVVFTGLIGVLIAPVHIHPFEAALAVLAIALGSGAAGAINRTEKIDSSTPRPSASSGATRPAAAG